MKYGLLWLIRAYPGIARDLSDLSLNHRYWTAAA